MSRLLLLPPTVGGVPNQPAAGQIIVATGAGNKVVGTGAGLTWSGNILAVHGIANTFGVQIYGISTGGQSYGLYVAAGTSAADYTVDMRNYAQTHRYLSITGDGAGLLGYNGSANSLTWDSTGKFSFVAAIGVNGSSPPAKVTGFGVPTGAGVISAFPGASATLAQCSQAIAQLITDLKAIGFYGA